MIVDKTEFIKALTKIKKIADGRDKLVLLSIMPDADGGGRMLGIRAAAESYSVRYMLPFQGEAQLSEVVVSGEYLLKILKELIVGDEVSITLENGDVWVQKKQGNVHMRGIDVVVPAEPDVIGSSVLPLSAGEHKKLLSRVVYAIGRNDIMRDLSYVYIASEGGEINYMCSDGYILATAKKQVDEPGVGKIVVGKRYQDVLSVIDDNTLLFVDDQRRWMIIDDAVENMRIFLKLSPVKFPEYEQIKPNRRVAKAIFTLSRDDFLGACRQARVFVPDKTRAACQSKKEKMPTINLVAFCNDESVEVKVIGENEKKGVTDTTVLNVQEVEKTTPGCNLGIRLAPREIVSTLQSMSERISVELFAYNVPIVLRPAGEQESGSFNLVMPVFGD